MRYGIALVGDRVAPRCVFAESVLVVALRANRARAGERRLLETHGLLDLTEVLSQCRIDALICGGISCEEREFLAARRVEIIDNVAGSTHEILEALHTGVLRPGFGLAVTHGKPHPDSPPPAARQTFGEPAREENAGAKPAAVDCLACRDNKCRQGEPCATLLPATAPFSAVDDETKRMLGAALDIAGEDERILCRLSELIYFCLEMRYERIGVAYCLELQEPAEILVRVLRRFLKVHPVCCKIGGAVAPLFSAPADREPKPGRAVVCNPQGQAAVLNRVQTDLNVIVGLCMGADCIFTRFSQAPVTALFVKDKSLANNPVGAVYSGHHLKEAIQATPRGFWRSQRDEPSPYTPRGR